MKIHQGISHSKNLSIPQKSREKPRPQTSYLNACKFISICERTSIRESEWTYIDSQYPF